MKKHPIFPAISLTLHYSEPPIHLYLEPSVHLEIVVAQTLSHSEPSCHWYFEPLMHLFVLLDLTGFAKPSLVENSE